jgi:hemerythrin-like domain-containing protein
MSTNKAASKNSSGKQAMDPLEILRSAHAEQAELCAMLEQIADCLPDEVDPATCRSALAMLRDELPRHHRDEELGLFPLLENRALREDNIREHLAQLSLEHATDESFANEISEELEELAQGLKSRNPNMLGYMLRGFFELYRRHLHWEDTVLLPLAQKRLTSEDLEKLSSTMAGHRLKLMQ